MPKKPAFDITTGHGQKRLMYLAGPGVDIGPEEGQYLKALRAGQDYGADPLPDGTYHMVPSGDIVGRDEMCRRLAKRNPGAYRHERLARPLTLRRRGLTKYRSTVTPTGHVLRIAYPPGRRQRGAGEVQAILHPKGNPTEADVQAARQFMAVLKHRNDKRYLKQVFGYVPAPAEIDAWAARLQSGATLRDALYTMHKYRHPHVNPCEKNPPNGGIRQPTRAELAELINLWHTSKVVKSSRYERMQLTAKWWNEAHPDDSRLWAYKILERQLAGLYAGNPAILHPKPPVKGAVLIYHRALEVAGSKAGIPHQCDAQCKKSGHKFLHKFSKACSIWGLPDGQVLIE